MAKLMQIEIPLVQAIVWFCCLLLPLLGGASVTGYYKHRLETIELHVLALNEVVKKSNENQMQILQKLAAIEEKLSNRRN